VVAIVVALVGDRSGYSEAIMLLQPSLNRLGPLVHTVSCPHPFPQHVGLDNTLPIGQSSGELRGGLWSQVSLVDQRS